MVLVCARTCVVHATAAVTVFFRPDVLKMLEKAVDFGKLSAVQFVPRGLIRLTFKDPDYKASLVERGMLNINGGECSVTNSDRPHTLVYIHHYPAEGDDEILCDDFKHFGKVVFCKRQTFMGRPDLLTGSRILKMSLEKPILAEVTIDGYPVRIWYRGIKPFCSICKVMGHKAADCAFNGKCMRCEVQGGAQSSQKEGEAPALAFMRVIQFLLMTLSVITLNANGIRDRSRRDGLVQWLRSHPVSVDLVRLQEKHCTSANECRSWFLSSGFNSVLSPGSTHSCGCVILYSPTLSLSNSWSDSDGRFLQCEFSFRSQSFRVCCLYAPNRNPARDQFLDGIHPKVDPSIPTLLCGDFNTVFDRSLNRRGSVPSDSSRESTTSLCGLFDACCVLYIYRYLHPASPGFTWTEWNGALASRIDIAGVPFLWITSVNSCSVVPCPFSDPCGVLTSVSVPDTVPPGPGLWKLNTVILKESEYVQLVTDFWRTWQGSKTVLTSLRNWWEDGKNRLKGLTINYCTSRSSTKKRNRDTLVNLIAHLKAKVDAGSVSCVTPYQSALSTLAALDREVSRGAQVRFRIRWVEEGETSSSYFFRLERKRSVDRWIPVLRDSGGSIVSSPEDLCLTLNSFYSDLFSATPTDPHAQSSLLSNLLSSLPPDQAETCKGLLTTEECLAAIKGMAKKKRSLALTVSRPSSTSGSGVFSVKTLLLS
ncbi:Transposon TX1 uncharacterized 149 kDa protein [Stylophora pistillata]|uniref:exodeoxyribonuclease III n=1 Tax=Stylophora pistillata TaxID=50429 RepID=A0A2B4SLM6_STYPI|nr:Transposon TX1 uncharacterized 149 kDa protein [Stylophora pistillata]